MPESLLSAPAVTAHQSLRVCSNNWVFERFQTSSAASPLGIKGYVRNLPTGDVEVHAEADEAALAAFKRVLEQGPRMARVTEVVENDLPLSGSYSSFVIRG